MFYIVVVTNSGVFFWSDRGLVELWLGATTFTTMEEADKKRSEVKKQNPGSTVYWRRIIQ